MSWFSPLPPSYWERTPPTPTPLPPSYWERTPTTEPVSAILLPEETFMLPKIDVPPYLFFGALLLWLIKSDKPPEKKDEK